MATKKRTSKRRSSKKKPVRRRRPGRFWVWLYYKPSEGDRMEAAMLPWGRWGSTTGSGSDGYESDISWEYATLATAKAKASAMHSLMKRAGVKHRVEIHDTAADYGSLRVATLGTWYGALPHGLGRTSRAI